ncbi:MAG: prolyl oligopeptidase family serine peptidase [Pirellulales bacterium]
MSMSLAPRARSVRLRRASLLLACCISAALPHSLLPADGPADNVASKVRPIPPVGIEVPAAVRDELLAGAKQLEARVAGLTDADKADTAEILVLSRAVRIAAEDGIFYNDKEFDQARGLLKLGNERVDALAAGKRGSALIGLAAAPSDKPQLLVGGFRSHIDGSIQPYGLVIPAGVDFSKNEPLRLDVWLHGRGENVSEVAFLNQRLKSVGEIAPEKTIVLHPYGRYCNAFKFAGEIDVLEAIEHVKSRFKIDNDRTNIRGFSMGGAGCWQMAVHYPQVWMAATPGAGFSETTEFLRVFQREEFKPTPYQKALLHWYDCPDWTNNLRHLPTVAYSGEIDQQKQAADVMAAAFKDRGMELKHIIGPQTAHKIHPDSKVEIERFLSDTAIAGRPKLPLKIDLTTYTLRYHRQAWLSIDGLEEHWREARVQAELQPPSTIVLKTSNITALTVKLPADQKVMHVDQSLTVRLNDQTISIQASSPGKESIHLIVENGAWKASDEVTRQVSEETTWTTRADRRCVYGRLCVRRTGCEVELTCNGPGRQVARRRVYSCQDRVASPVPRRHHRSATRPNYRSRPAR